MTDLRTTDEIVEDLETLRVEHLEAGRVVEAQRTLQQQVAHRALADKRDERMRADAAEDPTLVAGLEAQIKHWRGLVDEDAAHDIHQHDQAQEQPPSRPSERGGVVEQADTPAETERE